MLVGLALQVFAEVRVGDGDEGKGAFGDGLAFEVGDAVFCDDVHHVGACGGDDVARGEVEHDATAALAAFVIGRGQADERLAAF